MFLPMNLCELKAQGFDSPDFVVVSGDAYVDHPSFGHAVVARLLQAEGFGVGMLAQPQSDIDFSSFGEPKKAFLVSGGVVDSMVNNYSVSLKKRSSDDYSEGGMAGKRADRVVDVYCKALKRLYPSTPIIIGGIEASLRRLSHYDYWDDVVRHSILFTSRADLLIYGMGENPLWEIAEYAKKNVSLSKVKDIRGTAFLSTKASLPKTARSAIAEESSSDCVVLPSHGRVSDSKQVYCGAFVIAKENSEYFSAKTLVQKQDSDSYVVVNPPSYPLTEKQMDKAYSLHYERKAHPSYKKGVPAIEEVEFSVTAHRGCFGNCSFCALTYHQGRTIQARSEQSIINEVEQIASSPDFKGYIHDIGGPSANFHQPSCDIQAKAGVCINKNCIGYKPCPNLVVNHQKYLNILRRARQVKGVKKVFVRSGLRYDYMMMDKDKTFINELIEHHISGQLKVAPEHCAESVLSIMNKPSFVNYLSFSAEFTKINNQKAKNQFLVPYFISSHPGCSLKDAVALTEYLKSIGYMPKQVQDFYPTPSTLATTMYYTEMNPYTLQPIYVAKNSHDKALQRALLQYRLPVNKSLVEEAYRKISPSSAVVHRQKAAVGFSTTKKKQRQKSSKK